MLCVWFLCDHFPILHCTMSTQVAPDRWSAYIDTHRCSLGTTYSTQRHPYIRGISNILCYMAHHTSALPCNVVVTLCKCTVLYVLHTVWAKAGSPNPPLETSHFHHPLVQSLHLQCMHTAPLYSLCPLLLPVLPTYCTYIHTFTHAHSHSHTPCRGPHQRSPRSSPASPWLL